MSHSVEGKSSCHDLFVSHPPRPMLSPDQHLPPRHIFCFHCADKLGLSQPTSGGRHCPACQSTLLNPDDAVSTILNPTEDYKTSVLSGLDPNTIMECAGRALIFWAYQMTQEMYVVFAELAGHR